METQFYFKKKFGQNFLKNPSIVKNIALCGSILPNSLVIEVGPGSGVLTKELGNLAKHVLCYEIDTQLEDILASSLKDYDNITVKFEDFLNADINADLKDFDYEHLYFISNVPYYITTPILMKIMQEHLDVEKIVLMIQKEVGERFAATPGKKAYSSISVFLNYYYDIKKEFTVNRKEFVPVPNVDSIVISLSKKKELLFLKNEEHFFKLVKDSFMFKRKTIRNNLKNYDLIVIEKVLRKYHLDLTVRAEQLSLEVFVDLSNSLN